MGQYYRAVVLHNEKDTPKNAFVSYDYDNVAKLMEHSYIGNYFVLAVEKHLLDNPCRLVWAGDYADGEKGQVMHRNNGEEYELNLYDLCKATSCQFIKPIEGVTDYENSLSEIIESGDTFVVNHTKKYYYQRPDFNDTLVINPLPLLTCEGNGRGGGDYSGTLMELVGSWSRDTISLTHTRPTDMEEIEFPDFKEEW